jgi:cardiolipin synthase
MWVGAPQRGIAPWRDTGVELRGPAVADVAQAFARAWAETGVAIPADELPERAAIARCGDVGLRVLATMPAAAGLYRLDQMIAALARTTLWLTDAYFAGIATYIQALRQAALDGVDVRLLVPGASDVPILSPITRAGYRPLLEAGVRVFEWNGPMLHAKTAVADGRWSRVGSSNLNLASWLGNWELDVAVEDIGFASQMQQAYLADLEGATEIVLADRNRVRLAGPAAPSGGATHARKDGARRGRGLGGSAGQLAAGAARVGNTFGAAITNRRVLGTAEAKTMTIAAVVLIAVAAVAALWPQALAWPLAAFAVWSAIALLLRAARLHRKATEQLRAEQKPPD